MLNFSAMKKRYFTIQFEDGTKVELTPPKMKVLRVVSDITSQSGTEAAPELITACALILSGNSKKKKYTEKFVEDNLDIDEVHTLISEYFSWVSGIRNDPN